MNRKDNKSNHNDDLKGIHDVSINLMDTPFIVPESYFDTLPARIQRRINVIEDTASSFALPEGYFDSLSERIQARVMESELENAEEQNEDLTVNDYSFIKEISFINELKDKVPTTGFETPSNYFENLTEKIEESVKEQRNNKESAVLINLHKERKLKKLTWMGYAAAACIAISIGAYAFFQLNSVNSFQKKLHNISENEIVSYLEYYTEPGDATTILETEFEGAVQTNKANFSEEDIEAYLDYSI